MALKNTLLISAVILLLAACNTSTEPNSEEDVLINETTETHQVFVENEEGELELKEMPDDENDTVQVQDPKTGEWVKMTKKEAEALLETNKK